ncbi:Polysaccharide deacetylase [Frankia canadensis]|uniref:Polysaccharide deacetylase n=1 Tax=Frankia canadensis TaxID=1836972 RepID=A0A2I2KNM5_9ACTN|nr:polysaccharide deacetylase family protein [Frankia canadensis]SNQ47260.1 Polysaccharide deacetylase [Frankia canadensis]SOU54550.1 Polysaccharide deacetylase [Frankia canadensis]
MSDDSPVDLSRRRFLTAAPVAAAAAGLAACAAGSGPDASSTPSAPAHAAPAAGTPAASPPRGAVAASLAPDGPQLLPGGPATAVAHGPRDRARVALTFHLGPHEAGQDLDLARQLLGDAARLAAPITVFAVGQWLDEYRDLVPTILAPGNELANHTYTHPTLTALPAPAVATEITACRDVLARLAPTQGRYFRPSGTSTATPLILTEAGAAGYRTVVDFDVDPLDYTSPGADAVVARVRAGVQPGSIVSMHFGYPGTVSAFPRIVANLRTAGLTPVSLHTLLT